MEPAPHSSTLENRDGPPPVLEMREVAIAALRSPEQVMFEKVNWSVAAGDFWAIAGLHASGKSDFICVAAGVMLPLRGEYRVLGRELSPSFESDWLATRMRVGLVFDGGQLLSHLTLAENIALPIRYHQPAKIPNGEERVKALLELTNLTPWADQRPSSVTQNRRQRAGLARALALQPEVLLLDSPLTGLDPLDAAWWLDVLGKLSAGHAIAGGQPLTLIVTCDDLRPWQGRARQFGLLKDRTFVNLGSQPGAAADEGRWMETLLSADGWR